MPQFSVVAEENQDHLFDIVGCKEYVSHWVSFIHLTCIWTASISGRSSVQVICEWTQQQQLAWSHREPMVFMSSVVLITKRGNENRTKPLIFDPINVCLHHRLFKLYKLYHSWRLRGREPDFYICNDPIPTQFQLRNCYCEGELVDTLLYVRHTT